MEKRIRDELKNLKEIIVNTVAVEQIILFGSYANGTPHADSDIDILVIMPDHAEIREIDAMKLIHRAIRSKKTMPVDVFVSKKGIFDRRKKTPTLEREISQEGILLYGAHLPHPWL